MQQIIPNLWINDGKIEEAVDFYCSLFEDSRVVSSTDYGPDAGDVRRAEDGDLLRAPGRALRRHQRRGHALRGQRVGLARRSRATPRRRSTGSGTRSSRAGEPGPCGWLKDRYGFSWQVYPAVLDKMMTDADPEKVRRVTALLHGHRQAGLQDRRARGGLRRSLRQRPHRYLGVDVGGVSLQGFLPRRGTREPATAHAEICCIR